MFKSLALVVCAAAPLLAGEGGMTPAERSYLLDQLEQSKKEMLASIEGLTAAQWTFKPAPNVWSVQECAEHIIKSEEFIFNGAQAPLKTPAVARLASANAESDQKLVAGIKERSKKFTAPEPLVPSGAYATPADAAREFTTRRDKTMAYVKATNDDLRVHSAASPAGPMDSYQFLLLLAAHSSRHTAQLLEVKANQDFPKAGTR